METCQVMSIIAKNIMKVKGRTQKVKNEGMVRISKEGTLYENNKKKIAPVLKFNKTYCILLVLF